MRLFLGIFLFLFIFMQAIPIAKAQETMLESATVPVEQTTISETASSATENVVSSQKDVITPDSPLYFFKRFYEKLTLIFTFDTEKKLAKQVEILKNRADEITKSAQSGSENIATKLTDEVTKAKIETLKKISDSPLSQEQKSSLISQLENKLMNIEAISEAENEAVMAESLEKNTEDKSSNVEILNKQTEVLKLDLFHDKISSETKSNAITPVSQHL